MNATDELDAVRLRELLEYDANTGLFVWRVATSHRVRAGDVAGSLSSKGYVRIKINGRHYPAHRLAWFYTFGVLPLIVDHMNGNKSDNRLRNLRVATSSTNAANAKKRASRVAHKGVTACRSKFQASICVSGVSHHLGTFETPEEAHEAYKVAAVKYFGEFARFE